MMAFKIQENVLHYYANLLRQKTWEETNGALYNIIRTMRMVRNNKVCGEDFSCLDFSHIQINGIFFSLNGKYPSKFNKCFFTYDCFIKGHFSSVTCVDISRYSELIVTGSDIGEVFVWNIKTKEVIYQFHVSAPITMVAFLSHSEILVCISHTYVFIINMNQHGIVSKFRLSDPETNRIMFKNKLYNDSWKYEPLFFDSGKKKICLKSYFPTQKYKSIHDFVSPYVINTDDNSILGELIGHEAPINMIVASDDQKYLCTVAMDRKIILWSADNLKKISVFEGMMSSIISMTFSYSGESFLITSFSPYVNEYSIVDKKLIRTLHHNSGVECLSYSRTNKYIATGSFDQCIRIWDAKSDELIKSMNCGDAIMLIDISDEWCIYVCLGQLSCLNLFCHSDSISDRIIIDLSDDIKCIKISEKGNYCIVATKHGKILIHDLTNKKAVYSVKIDYSITTLDLIESSKESLSCVVGGADGKFIMWDLEKDKVTDMWNLSKKESTEIEAFRSELLHIRFINSANTIIGVSRTEVLSLDLEKANFNSYGFGNRIYNACISPDGISVAIQNGINSVQIINSKSGEVISEFLNIDFSMKNCQASNISFPKHQKEVQKLIYQQGALTD